MEEERNLNAEPFKSGYVAIIGAPNVGKSTLLNQFLGQKLSITAPKPQTTRNRIRGIMTAPGYQIIFIDTPGIHRARDDFNRVMVETALLSLNEADAICFMIDAGSTVHDLDDFILGNIAKVRAPVVLAVNKVDLMRDKRSLLPLMESYQRRMEFRAIVPISAQTGDGVSDLFDELLKLIPEGPRYYPEEYVTDQPERFFVAELVREKIFHLLKQELPYAVAVTIDKFTEIQDRDRIDIEATINVERDNQKGIIIGKGGKMLKEIGQQARLEIETFLGCHIYLGLFVRVQKNWRKDPRVLAEFGYEPGR